MKVFDSGMPEEDYWESLFDVELILRSLQIGPHLRDLGELGCGSSGPEGRLVAIGCLAPDLTAD